MIFSVNASADVYNIKTINLHKGKNLVEAKVCGGTHLENSEDISERSIEFSERGTDIFNEGKSVYIKSVVLKMVFCLLNLLFLLLMKL